MDNEHSALNDIKNILNESRGMVLDKGLLRKIEIELEKRNCEVVKVLKNAEICRKPGNAEDHILQGIKSCEGIVDVIGEGLCLLDKDLKVIWANKTISDWLGLRESPVGNYCKDIFHCCEAGVDNCQAQEVFHGGEGRIIEMWITTKTGKRICVQRNAIPIKTKNGDISNVLVHTVDATENEKSVHRLMMLQHLGEAMQGTLHLDRLFHLILTCVTSGYAFGFNQAMLFLVNKENNTLYGKLAVGPSSPEEANRIWQEISSRYSSLKQMLENLDYNPDIDTPLNTMTKLKTYSLSDEKEVVASCARGKTPIVLKDAANDPRVTEELRKALGVNEFVCVPLFAKEEPKGVIVADNIYTGEPITEDRVSLLTMFANQAALAIENAEIYKRLEEKINQLTETQQRLIRSEKLAAIGSMASYIAHEIRNPLVTIGGFAKSLTRFSYGDSGIKTNIGIILDEVRRLETILNDLMDISKPPRPEKINVHISEIVDGTCSLMENYLNEKNISLSKKFEPDLPQIMADPGQIKQVVLNILRNAVEAMPDGGDLVIEIKMAGESIKISTTDTGKGMREDELKEIFKPFCTSKSSGTGIGMAISLKIIKDHGGHINVESEYGKGTTMSITLPTECN